jgi:hypothetical protein
MRMYACSEKRPGPTWQAVYMRSACSTSRRVLTSYAIPTSCAFYGALKSLNINLRGMCDTTDAAAVAFSNKPVATTLQ